MNRWRLSPIPTFIGILAGGIVLFGYFINFQLLMEIRELFLHWAVILSGVALFVGVINLLSHHINTIRLKQTEYPYSLILVCSLVMTTIIVGYFGLTSSMSLWILDYIHIPLESSLVAVLAIVLLFMLVRLLHRKRNLSTIIFFTTVIIIIFGTIPIFDAYLPWIYGSESLINLIFNTISVAGIRGILIGIALGVITTGLRILIGVDRPYGG